MNFKTSLDEYTKEEKEKNGNQIYGGKRHDEICDYLQKSYHFSESDMTDISCGIWLAIQSERRVGAKTQALLDEAAELIKYFVARCDGVHPDGFINSRKTYTKYQDFLQKLESER